MLIVAYKKITNKVKQIDCVDYVGGSVLISKKAFVYAYPPKIFVYIDRPETVCSPAAPPGEEVIHPRV